MTRDQVQEIARGWLGVPFRDRGRSRSGVDCIGLLCVIADAIQIPYQDVPGYSIQPSRERLILTYFDKYLIPLKMDYPWPGTIGVFAGAILPAHVGLFSWKHGQLHLIHARKDCNKVIEQPFSIDDRSEGRVVARYAFPGLED